MFEQVFTLILIESSEIIKPQIFMKHFSFYHEIKQKEMILAKG